MIPDSQDSKPVQIRFAQSNDAEQITAVINSAFRPAEAFFVDGDRIDVADVSQFFNLGTFLLAESESTLLGCVYVEPARPDLNNSSGQSEKRSYLGLLSVDPSHQQSGVGSMLMEAAEDYCRGLGQTFMDIKVVNLREELSGFYRKRGYVETGTSAFPADVTTKVPCHFVNMSKPLNQATGS